jgi:ferric iron reductase protein FhuF
MLCRLAAEERAYLTEHFRLLEEDGSEGRVSFAQLKDPVFLQVFLDSQKTELGTDSTLAAASQLVKRVGYLAAVPPLFTAAVFGKALDMDFDTCFLVQRRQGDVWMPRLFLADASAADLGDGERYVLFERFARQLFGDLAEVVQAVSAAASVPRSLLWENIAIYVYWLYESRLMEECDNGVRLQAWGDFEFILHELPASVFGERANPLHKFHKEKTVPTSGEEAVRIRQTCCFAYETGKGKSFCKTCPKKIEKVHL